MNKKTKKDNSVINIGSGKDYSIEYYAKVILKIFSLDAKIVYDNSKPTGTHRKLLDSSVAKKYGWESKTKLTDGLIKTINSFNKK